MGTWIELHQFGPPAASALRAARRAIERVDDALTIHRTSPTTLLNERLRAGKAAFVADPILLEALTAVDQAWSATAGLFDVTAGSGVEASWSTITFDRSDGRVGASGPVALDFGGFGKGFALDQAEKVLRGAGVSSALLSAGESSIAIIGGHPLGGDWPLAVPDPTRPEGELVRLHLSDAALSISSTVGSGASWPDRSPIINPRSGRAVDNAATTIAVAPSGAMAETMSTALLAADPVAAARLIAADPGRRFFFTYEGAARPHLPHTERV